MILLAALLLVVVAYLFVGLAIVYTVMQADRKPFEAHPRDFGLQYEDVTFAPRGSDLELRGWLLKGAPGAPFLIIVHGINSQRTDSSAVELASRLIREGGYSVLLFDLRAHGESGGSRTTAGDRERDDVLGAYDFLLGRGAEPGRVGLIGRSYGAGIAIMAAALEPGIGAVVADSTFSSVSDKAAHEISLETPIPEWLAPVFMPPVRLFARLLYDIDIGDLSPERGVAKLRYPVLVIHGEADARTPVSQGRRVYEAAPSGSELWTLPGVEHTQAFPTHPDEYTRRVLAYLGSRFPADGRPLETRAPAVTDP